MRADYKLIGSRIRLKRKEAGQTQEQLAEKLGVTVGYISQVERGVTKISLDLLAELCTALSCDMAFPITGAAAAQNAYLQKELLEKYALLNPQQRRIVLDMMDVLLKNGCPS